MCTYKQLLNLVMTSLSIKINIHCYNEVLAFLQIITASSKKLVTFFEIKCNINTQKITKKILMKCNLSKFGSFRLKIPVFTLMLMKNGMSLYKHIKTILHLTTVKVCVLVLHHLSTMIRVDRMPFEYQNANFLRDQPWDI